MKHDWKVEDYREYKRALSRNSQKKRRKIAKTNGMCSICCVKPARKGMATCMECSLRAINNAKIKRIEYISNGMCSSCGKNKPSDGYKRCEKCIERANKYAEKWKGEIL